MTTPQDSPARREAAERERRQRQAEEAIRNDPLVQDLMSQFKSARTRPADQTALRKDDTMMKNQLAGLMKQAQA